MLNSMASMYASSLFRAPGEPSALGPNTAQLGFTAIELMVVVAIVALLAALAAPSFNPLIERWRVRSAAETLTSSLYYARSEAIKRGGNVVIVKNSDTTTCTAAANNDNWGCGWRIFFDANGNGAQDACVPANTPNECDLQVVAAPTRMLVNLPGSTGSISVDRWGMFSHTTGAAAPTNMFFELMPKDKTISDASAARLCAGTGGRIARKKGSETC